LEQLRAHGFGMGVEGPGSQQGLSFGRCGHGRSYNTTNTTKKQCQVITAQKGAKAHAGLLAFPFH
jgi:hypothetical protein